MTRDETLKIMSVLKATYPSFYKDMTRRDAEGVVALWADMFAEDSYNTVAAAVRAFIVDDSKGFPPVVGQVKQRVTEISRAKSALPESAGGCDARGLAWMREYIQRRDTKHAASISRFARERGLTWPQAEEALG